MPPRNLTWGRRPMPGVSRAQRKMAKSRRVDPFQTPLRVIRTLQRREALSSGARGRAAIRQGMQAPLTAFRNFRGRVARIHRLKIGLAGVTAAAISLVSPPTRRVIWHGVLQPALGIDHFMAVRTQIWLPGGKAGDGLVGRYPRRTSPAAAANRCRASWSVRSPGSLILVRQSGVCTHRTCAAKIGRRW